MKFILSVQCWVGIFEILWRNTVTFEGQHSNVNRVIPCQLSKFPEKFKPHYLRIWWFFGCVVAKHASWTNVKFQTKIPTIYGDYVVVRFLLPLRKNRIFLQFHIAVCLVLVMLQTCDFTHVVSSIFWFRQCILSCFKFLSHSHTWGQTCMSMNKITANCDN